MEAFKEALEVDEAEAKKAGLDGEGIDIIHGLEEADAPTPAPRTCSRSRGACRARTPPPKAPRAHERPNRAEALSPAGNDRASPQRRGVAPGREVQTSSYGQEQSVSIGSG